MIRFEKANYDEIKPLRNEYFDSTYEAQELYLELIAKQSDYYIITYGQVIGYFIIAPDHTLVEYFISKTNIKNCEWIFKIILNDFKVCKVYCKSFDSVLLKSCMSHALPYQVIGTLFRDFFYTRPDAMEDFYIRHAVDSDIPELLQYTDELYESEAELFQMVGGGNILMYHLENQLIGCGYLTRTMENREFYDIGMWVATPFRKQGFASRIIAHLKGYCLENNLVPICGCAVDNLASRKTLEKNGFFSKHDLLEFQIK